MTWVITRLCQDCVDLSCLEVCPVDCIVEPTGAQKSSWPNQLLIDPNECIDCGACEPECPWEAIFQDENVPDAFAGDIALNARVIEFRDAFAVPDRPREPKLPSPEDLVRNRARWGLTERP